MDDVSAICPVCDTTVVLPATAMVLVAEEFSYDCTLGGWAMWACGTCGDWSAVAVDHNQFAALRALGGCVDGAGHPAWPPTTHGRPAQRAPITLDDLIELHQLLERPDWFDTLLRCSGVAGDAE